MLKTVILLPVILLIASAVSLADMSEGILLKSGDIIDGRIVRTVGSNVTIRTSSGFSTYHIDELDNEWVNDHYDKIFTRLRPRPADQLKEFGKLFAGLFGQESLASGKPFLMRNRNIVLPVCAVLSGIGILLCVYGWRIFKFSTILGGITSGVIMGLCLGWLLAESAGTLVAPRVALWLKPAIFVVTGGMLAYYGGMLGRRFAMFNARTKRLRGIGRGGFIGLFMALSRFAFFDLSIIWGYALWGGVLLIVGLYCGMVPLLDIPDAQLHYIFYGCVAAGAAMCVMGAMHQIHHLRTAPAYDRRGEY